MDSEFGMARFDIYILDFVVEERIVNLYFYILYSTNAPARHFHQLIEPLVRDAAISTAISFFFSV